MIRVPKNSTFKIPRIKMAITSSFLVAFEKMNKAPIFDEE